MAITYLKKAEKTPLTGTDETRRIVETMLARIEAEGEEAAIAYGCLLYTSPSPRDA